MTTTTKPIPPFTNRETTAATDRVRALASCNRCHYIPACDADTLPFVLEDLAACRRRYECSAEWMLSRVQRATLIALLRARVDDEISQPLMLLELRAAQWHDTAHLPTPIQGINVVSTGSAPSHEIRHLVMPFTPQLAGSPAEQLEAVQWSTACPFDDVASSGHAVRARQILQSALDRYRRPDGYEGYLVEAAWQLEEMRLEAWPALRELLLAEAQECEYFLGAVVRLAGVASQDRLTALLAAARNPDANVRSRLLELLEEMPGDLRGEVLRELTAEGRPDDSVTDRAREAEPDQVS